MYSQIPILNVIKSNDYNQIDNKNMKMIPPDESGNEVAQFNLITLVHMCANAHRELDKASQTLRQGTQSGQNVKVTQHIFVDFAVWAIRMIPYYHFREGSKIWKPHCKDIRNQYQ